MSKEYLISRTKALIQEFGGPGGLDVEQVTTSTKEQLAAALSSKSVIVTDAWVLDNLIKPLNLDQKCSIILNEDIKEGDLCKQSCYGEGG